MISFTECQDRRLYIVDSRNLTLGVYCEADKSFYGIRTKWGSRFIDNEYHWDTGEPYGTCKPLEELPVMLPDSIQLDNKNELFDWLEKMEMEHEHLNSQLEKPVGS